MKQRTAAGLLAPLLAPLLTLPLTLLLTLVATGCATRTEAPVDAALFARQPAPAERRLPGRVALWMPPQPTHTVEAKTLLEAVRVPIGRIVEEATMAALRDAMQGGAVLLKDPPTPGSGSGVTLVVEAVQLTLKEQTEAELGPVPPFVFPARVTYGQLALEMSLLDDRGRKLWTRRYDAGRERWFPPAVWTTPPAPWTTLPQTYTIMRRSHEAAWLLAQQAAKDVRDWLAADRGRPRDL